MAAAEMGGPSSPRRSRIAHFKAHFIVSVAGAVSLGLACGGNGNGETDGCGSPQCNPPPPPPPPPACGTFPPELGTSCAGNPGLSCSYDTCIGHVPMRQCGVGEVWVDIPVPACNPPALAAEACEATLPVAGSDCTIPQLSCFYRSDCTGGGWNTATCVGGQWLIVPYFDGRCDPVPVVPVCPERQLVTGEECAYEGQACIRGSCDPGVESHAGHVCSGNRWQAAVAFCAPGNSTPDAGASDAGVRDGGG